MIDERGNLDAQLIHRNRRHVQRVQHHVDAFHWNTGFMREPTLPARPGIALRRTSGTTMRLR